MSDQGRPYRGFVRDNTDWWPAHESRVAMPLRYQLLLRKSGAVLRVEMLVLSDNPEGEESTGFQLGLHAADCRQLGQHLLEMAEMIEPPERTVN